MNISEKMQDLMTKGMAASREVLQKASAQAQVWGEMGVLKVEIHQLRSQEEHLIGQLGALAYAALAERGEPSLSGADPKVGLVLARIRELEAEIAEKEARFRKLGGTESDLEREDEAQ